MAAQQALAAKKNVRRTVTAIALAAIIVFAGYFVATWWIPKAQFGCDGWPWGPSTAQEAAKKFAESIVAQDAKLACSAVTSNFTEETAAGLLKESAAALGNPTSIDDITITLGEQGGSYCPATFRTETGRLPVHLHAFWVQWRVSSVG